MSKKQKLINGIYIALILLQTVVMKIIYYSYSMGRPLSPYYGLSDIVGDIAWSTVVIGITIAIYVIFKNKQIVPSYYVYIVLLMVTIPFVVITMSDILGVYAYTVIGNNIRMPLGFNPQMLGYIFALFMPFIIEKTKRDRHFLLEMEVINLSIFILSKGTKSLKPGVVWSAVLIVSIIFLVEKSREKMLGIFISIFVIAVDYINLKLEWTASDTSVFTIFKRLTSFAVVPPEHYRFICLYIILTVVCFTFILLTGLRNKTITRQVMISICCALFISIANVLGEFDVISIDTCGIIPFARYSGSYYYIWFTYICVQLLNTERHGG